MERAAYSTDLKDIQWTIMLPFLNLASSKAGRPAKYALREIINAILYLVHTGCQWREIPHDFPPWRSVYYYFRKYDQLWATIHRAIHSNLREDLGKNPEPSDAIIDSQSVKASQMAESRGFDGNKKIKGRKRHLVVDTLGFPLVVKVHDANLADSKQAFGIMKTLFFWFAGIKKIWADSAYIGDLAKYLFCAFFCKLEKKI
jgi:putative transposase